MKYRGIAGYDPDKRVHFTIYDKHLEFKSGKGNVWSIIAVPPDYKNGKEDEPFIINSMLHEMIVKAPTQDEHIQMIYAEENDESKEDGMANKEQEMEENDDEEESEDGDDESSGDDESKDSSIARILYHV